MYLKRVDGPRQMTVPDGRILSWADLPPVDTRRWVASRKAIVVRAVAYGLIMREEALKRYALCEEELESWCRAMAEHGGAALKVTLTQKQIQLKVVFCRRSAAVTVDYRLAGKVVNR